MSDFAQPILTTLYTLVLDYLKARDVDAITMCLSEPSNKPVGTLRYVRSDNKFQEWDGAAWNDKVIGITGGGTGGATAGTARTSLGLGDMSTQSSAAVSITGGSIAGNGAGLTTLNAASLSAGTVPTARLGTGVASAATYLRGDQAWTALSTHLVYAALQSADFTAAYEMMYPLTGTHVLSLPTVIGHDGERVAIANLGTGVWTVNTFGTETILGATTFSFSYGQYSSLTLVANANNLGWDIY